MMLKVAHIVLSLKYGGLEKLTVDLCVALQKRGISAPLICLTQGGALQASAKAQGVKVIALNRKREGFDPVLLWSLIQVLRRERCDLVHTHNFGPLVYGTLAARLLGVPCLNTRHGRAALRTHPLIWQMNRHVVAVSEDARRELLKNNRLDEKKVSVIYNGISVETFQRLPPAERAALRQEFGLASDAHVIGTVARLAKEKDQVTLLQAFARVAAWDPQAVLVLVGDGPLRQSLEDLAAELSVTDRVHFLGFRNDTARLYNLFDVFVLPSLMEGVSLTLLEAMANACPIVTTKVGGNPEVAVEGRTGVFVLPQDSTQLAEVLENVLGNPQKALVMGEEGLMRVKEIFNLEKMTGQYLSLYQIK